ncbi:2-phytyl-1,4-beta-naphthoquinone methyltransferase, chloroplastic-like isoform X1 [Durio zibethinus]|uniref:2-phytyl-1,4-beta-naphthoquinone methyltransferase, chloroplastic-like isoform X1 n=1 Tax=Durio zibethinus TaxID=66656 RepID=A0A6P5XZ28_DURZI|nr:2-phytyl-1,4-beta-naphthoquinone methyltransferase, chloroplastic-like isoform X1 [Durio zibethinus]XP_022733411.1 2-phytyl-1,4-beta-naphthoquinone methyltransferase, chloroplastic-like isoform X1 [Durio zibethinus]XP_022733413.1 2-phytyl-1,4-beta-naphthoquinone methyltransferase, chloroplastic-like isoform X1 [Durio zibethinus]
MEYENTWLYPGVLWAKTEDSVLDLCCGTGDLTFLMSEKVGSYGKVTGFDFSKEQLSIASSRHYLFSKVWYNNIEWVEGDALDLPFSNGYFDAITKGYGLCNVVDNRMRFEF